MKKIIYIICLLTIISPAFSQSPAYFNYQAAVRDSDGEVIKNKLVSIKISILEGNDQGQVVFTENHFAISSASGIINLLIGDGQNQNGNLIDIDWALNEYWIEVKMDENGGNDYVLMNSSKLVSVPYALHAETASFTENVDDADADPENEIQQLALQGRILSISDGNSVELPETSSSLDDDPSNELQSLSSFKEGMNVNLSISDGEGTSFSIQDGDANASNELQNLEIIDNQLGISDGNTIDISSLFNSYWQDASAWDSSGIYYWGNVYMDTVGVESKLTIRSNNTYSTEIYDREFNMDDNSSMLFSRFKPSGLEFRSNNFLNLSHFTKDSIMFKNRYEGQADPISSNFEAKGLLVRGENMTNSFFDSGVELEDLTNLMSLNAEKLMMSQDIGLNNFKVRMISTGDTMSYYNIQGQRTLRLGSNKENGLGIIELFDGSGNPNATLGTRIFTQDITDPNAGGLQLFSDGFMTIQLESKTDGGYLKFNNYDEALLSKYGTDEAGRAELSMNGGDGDIKVMIGVNEDDMGQIDAKGSINIIDENDKVVLSENENGLNLYNQNDKIALSLGKTIGSQGGAGLILVNDASEYSNFYAGANILDNNLNSGFAGVYNHFGILKAGMKVSNGIGNVFGEIYTLQNAGGSTRGVWQSLAAHDAGLLYLYGPNNLPNVSLEYANENKNRGAIKIFDENGQARAGLFIRENTGNGELFADVKHFRMDHPEEADKEIWYASLEGPEAGAYVRGSATLQNGEAFVEFPDHFKMVANAESMTVILTPLFWDTFGLAVVEKQENGIKVKELKGGQGNFDFDWEVKCVRKGFENYEVIKKKDVNEAILKSE